MTREAAAILAPLMGVGPESALSILCARQERQRRLVAQRFELTDKGKAEVESDAMRFLRHRNELSGRLSLIEQAYWQRNRDEQQDTSSAQPHRFRGAD